MPPPADLLSDAAIAQAYEDVRSDKSETTWLVLKYATGTSDSLNLAGTGTGDIKEMTESLGEDEAAYAFMRMTLGNDEYSERTKFVFVIWQGPKIKIMRRAKMGVQSGEVKKVIRSYAIEITTDDKRDLEADTVTLKLRRAMGANYDRQGSAY